MTGFTRLVVDLDILDGSWGEYLQDGFKHGVIDRVGNLPDGTSAGKPAFQLLATLDDGSQVIVETTWAAMDAAAGALRARWSSDFAANFFRNEADMSIPGIAGDTKEQP